MAKKILFDYYSIIKKANGKLLEVELFFNDPIDNVIEKLKQFKLKYPEYDWLELENDRENGYCLIGYCKELKNE